MRSKTASHSQNGSGNRITDEVRERVIDLALDEPELSPQELAVTFMDTRGYFVTESSVYRSLKAQDLVTSPAFIVIKSADEFHDKTTAPKGWSTPAARLAIRRPRERSSDGTRR